MDSPPPDADQPILLTRVKRSSAEAGRPRKSGDTQPLSSGLMLPKKEG